MTKFAALGLALLATTALAAPAFADDDDDRGRRGDTSTWINADQVGQKLTERGYSRISEIERDDGRYEVDATGPDGRRMDLKVSPKTGEIVRSKGDDDDDDDDRYDD